jgi:phosphoglycolate phosphatase
MLRRRQRRRDPLQAIIFDCDGVLFDSTPANVAFYKAVLDALGESGLVLDENRVQALSSAQVFAELFEDDPARHAEATRIAAAVDYRPFFRLMIPVDDLHGILRDLGASYRLAMATNRGRTIPDLLQEFGLEGVFEAIVGILDVPRPKPHPDMLIECAERLGIEPDAAVYVGDSDGDREAAAAAGMPFIGVGDRSGHTVRVSTIGELPAVLGPTRGSGR